MTKIPSGHQGARVGASSACFLSIGEPMISTSLTAPARLQKNVLRQAKRFSKSPRHSADPRKDNPGANRVHLRQLGRFEGSPDHSRQVRRRAAFRTTSGVRRAQAYLARNVRDLAQSLAPSGRGETKMLFAVRAIHFWLREEAARRARVKRSGNKLYSKS